MNERKRVLSLLLIMATASLIVAGIAISVLYRVAYEEERARLVESCQSQARLIEAIARFDVLYSKNFPEGPEGATLSQIVDAHKHYKGFGKTGEFTLARREGDSIVFLLSHRHYDLKYPKPVPFDSELAEPMRRALLGLSGTLVGLDYRGEVVLAAHEPVAELNLGIVAKIDLTEIRRPFVKAGVTAGFMAVLIVLAGAALFLRLSNPMIRRLQGHTAELAKTNEQMKREVDERERAQEQLRFQIQLLDNVRESLVATDLEGHVIYWGKGAQELYGYRPKEVMGKPITFTVEPEEKEQEEERMRQVFETGLWSGEYQQKRKDGSKFWADTVISLIKDQNGQPRGVIGIDRDITDRKRAEAQIMQAKQEWERTFDAVPDLIMILDNKHRVVRVNKAMADRLGCTPNDLVGQICYDAFHGTKEPAALCPHARLMADGLAHTAEVHEDRLGGDFLVSADPLHNPDGKLVGSVHVARDITERKKAEDALRESEKRYRDLYENAPNAYFSISAVDGSILRCNSAAQGLLGYDKETITRMNVLDLYADKPHGISKAREILKRFKAGKSIQDVELQMKRKDGQPIWISLTVEPLKDRDGNVIESRSMVINISERKRAEEALQKAHDELERRVEERTAKLKQEIKERGQAEQALRESEKQLRYLSSQLLTAQEKERERIARELHDGIGQSLSAIKFSVENSLKWMDKETPGPMHKSLEAAIPMIQESVEEVRKIAMDLRPATLDDLGILATISWFCREFQMIYSGIRIEKEIDIQENEVPDPLKTAIYRVLQEALNNVAKHSKANLAAISLKSTDGMIELVIQDNGMGFDLEKALSVENSRKGLGLSSMKERTELSGGSFFIESGKGKGTNIRAAWKK